MWPRGATPGGDDRSLLDRLHGLRPLTALATLLVWGPVVAFELLGDRAVAWLERAQAWLARRQRTVASASLVVGALAAGDSLAALL